MISFDHPVVTRALLTTILLLIAGSALADSQIRGKITDAGTDRPLASAEVRIVELGRRVTTDSSGNYIIQAVPAGNYTLAVTYVGYDAAEFTVTATDSGVVTEDVAMTGVGTTEEILVTGFRASQLSSVQDKNAADIIKDSIDANDAGKLPDQNAAEALQRIPGVAITIDQGEGRYVSIRGIDPALNNITIDGRSIGAPEADDRRIALDTIPSEVLSKLEVIKTLTPDLDGNSIGGAVNLITPSPYDDPDGRMFTASADVGYYELNGKSPYTFNAAWSQVFGAEEQFGVLITGSFSHREYASENVQTDIWEEEGDYYVPGELVLRNYSLERERQGIVANFEWRPSDDVKVYWRNLFNEFQDTEDRIETQYDYREGDLEDQTPTSGIFTEGEGARAYKRRLEKQSIAQSTLGGEWLWGDNTLEAGVTWGESEQDTPYDNEWSFEVEDSLPMMYDTSNLFPRVNAPDAFVDPGFYEFNQVDMNNQLVSEDLQIYSADMRHDMNFGGAPGYLKGGIKYTGREKRSDVGGPSYDGYEDDLLLSQFYQPGPADFYDSVRPGFYTFGPQIDYDAIQAFFNNNQSGFEQAFDDTSEAEYAEDFRVNEDVSAAYFMGGVDLDNLTITAGVRVEKTDSDYQAYEVLFDDGDFAGAEPTYGSQSYTDWLPDIVLRYQATDAFVVRGAWTNSIARPGYVQLVPYRIFEFEPNDDDELEGELEEGNPDLDRLQSSNFDLSFEYYLESGGILSAGLFYKDIDNPIFFRSESFEEILFDGRFFAELEITRPENADSGDIKGVELNYQQQFVELPSPWNSFGVNINYTYTDGKAEVFDRDDELPFFLQPDNVGNVQLYFERAGFEARLAYAYRSEYLDEVGGDPNEDLYVAERGQLDFKARYSFNENYEIYLEVLNITDEPLRFYSGDGTGRLAENEIYSWNAVIGVQINF